MSNQTHETRPYAACFVCLVGGGWRRNTKHEKRAISGAFFVFRVGGGWRTSKTRRTHPYGCVLRGLGGGDGVGVAPKHET